jgi:hypothetical protein
VTSGNKRQIQKCLADLMGIVGEYVSLSDSPAAYTQSIGHLIVSRACLMQIWPDFSCIPPCLKVLDIDEKPIQTRVRQRVRVPSNRSPAQEDTMPGQVRKLEIISPAGSAQEFFV